MLDQEQRKILAGKAWPFFEAERIWQQIQGKMPEKGYVLFETGYGPSGLPHIGTFGEVVRTAMVRCAFTTMFGMPTKLIAFSDDMDGLRKVPDNIPNQEMVKQYIGRPLTSIPDPFGTHESYGSHMNAKLCEFLDRFGFDYEFQSATNCYKSGVFDQALLTILKYYEPIMAVMLPTLGEERQATYSPFLPVCPVTGKVLQVPIIERDEVKGTVCYNNDKGEKITVPVTGGGCKLQRKVDWAMRWCALDVNFEMHGKDLMSSAELSSKICRIIGKEPPVLFKYELFLDEAGQKISKSKGNGLTIEQWLRYAPVESLSLFMYNSPNKAKRLHFDVIPKNVDDYINFSVNYNDPDMTSPLWHVHYGSPIKHRLFGLNYSLLLNLASVCNPDDEKLLWGFITKYTQDDSIRQEPLLAELVRRAIFYYEDFIRPNKKYRIPAAEERIILKQISDYLAGCSAEVSSEEIQNSIYSIGKGSGMELKVFFQAMYEIVLGQTQGPRLGTFIKLFGINEFIGLIEKKLDT